MKSENSSETVDKPQVAVSSTDWLSELGAVYSRAIEARSKVHWMRDGSRWSDIMIVLEEIEKAIYAERRRSDNNGDMPHLTARKGNE